jgi:hypothetical protein
VARAYGDRIRVVAVTAEAPPLLRELQRELDLPFHLLSDPMGTLLSRCELTHCVAIVDSHGVVRWGVVSGNWDRLEPVALAQATTRYAGHRMGTGRPEKTSAAATPPDLESVLQAVTSSCTMVSVDGWPPNCRLSGQCQTGFHEIDCRKVGEPCQCTTSSRSSPVAVPYDPSFCVDSNRVTSNRERFAAGARACGFPL